MGDSLGYKSCQETFEASEEMWKNSWRKTSPPKGKSKGKGGSFSDWKNNRTYSRGGSSSSSAGYASGVLNALTDEFVQFQHKQKEAREKAGLVDAVKTAFGIKVRKREDG